MYERLIKDVKKTLYKLLGRKTLSFEQLEMVIIDIEKHFNSRPLTDLESDGGEEQVLTTNVLMWGQNAHQVEQTEEDGDEVSKLHKRLRETKQHGWRTWKHKYVRSLLESHRGNRKAAPVPDRDTRDQITQDLDSIFPDFSKENERLKKENSSLVASTLFSFGNDRNSNTKAPF